MHLVQSSGDLLADRRYLMAESLAAGGDLDAARDLLAETLGLVPGWAAGWYRLGEWHEEAGCPDLAAAAWERALAADPADRMGAGPRRDLIRRVPVVETMPAAYVETLFDQYAPDFDQALSARLDYRVPDLLRGLVPPGRRFGRAVDLGCGTGLSGAAFRDCCTWFEGHDISAGMLAQAGAKGIYDALHKTDLGLLEIGPDRYDLIVAADVFVYLGALERILGWAAAMLAPGGMMLFSVEAAPEDTALPLLRDSRRFAHSRSYLSGVLTAAGFEAVQIAPAVLRQDRGAGIAGYLVAAGAPVPVRDRQGDGEDAALV